MKVVTAAQMAAIERASERAGVSTDTLMENAGLAVAQTAREVLGGIAGAGVLVLTGPGNNGADGLVAARHLRRWGGEVTCYLVTPRPEADPKMLLALEYGVQLARADEDDANLAKLDWLLSRSRLVIDAVLGTGRARPLQGPMKAAMLRLEQAKAKPGGPFLLALDLPTGLNADTGEADPACPRADLTAALGYPKAGMLRFPGAERVGLLRVLDIGVRSPLPSGLSAAAAARAGLPEEQSTGLELLTPEWVSARLPQRPPDSHKGVYGHALIVAGSRNYVGAAYLASQASVRAGAGLTTLASPESVYPLVAAKGAEAIHLPLPEIEGRVDPAAADLLKSQQDRRYTALAVGCGMGASPGGAEFLERLLLEPDAGAESPAVRRLPALLPALIDADGLNNLSRTNNWARRVRNPLVLTPHPGEMSTLTGLPVSEIQAAREDTAREWAERWGACVVLKGAFTVVAAPAAFGPAAFGSEPVVRIAPFANPGLATGGTGDVLSGVIVGLMAQGLSPYDAACCGVYVHGEAGEAVTARQGRTGLAASDLLDALPKAMDSLRRRGFLPR